MPRALLTGLRWSLLGLLALLLLATAAVELVSWNFLKDPIAEQVEAATGRSFAIEGDLSLSLFPRPRASASGLMLGNPSWAASAHLLEVGRLSVALSVPALLAGRIALAEVTVQGPVLHLATRPDGTGNWRLRAPSTPGNSTGNASVPPLAVHSLTISDALIRYDPPDNAEPAAIALRSLDIVDDGSSLTAAGEAEIRGRLLELEADTDSINALLQDETAFKGKVSVRAHESRLAGSFVLPRAQGAPLLRADWQARLKNIAGWSEWLGLPPVALGTLELAAHLEGGASQWRLTDMRAESGESRLTGEITVDASADPLRVSGHLHAPELEAVALQRALGTEAGSAQTTAVAIPVLPALSAGLDLEVDRLRLQRGVLESLSARLELDARRLSATSFSAAVGQGRIEGAASLQSTKEWVTADMRLAVRDLSLAAVPVAGLSRGRVTADLAVALGELKRTPAVKPATLLERLRIHQAQLSYADAEVGTRLEVMAALDAAGEPATPVITLQGTLRRRHIDAELRGDPLPGLAGDPAGYALLIRGNSEGLRARIDTDLRSLLQPQQLEADLELSGDDGKGLQAWLGQELPPIPPFQLAAGLRRDGQLWLVSGLDVRVERSRVGGSLRFRNADRPSLEADLNAELLDLSPFSGSPAASPRQAQGQDATVAATLALLQKFDAQVDFSAGKLALPNGLALHEVAVEAELMAGKLTAEPVRLRVGEGSVAGSLALNANRSPASARIDANLKAIRLGQLADSFTPVEEKLGVLSGALHLDLMQSEEKGVSEDTLLPWLARMTFEPSTLRFVDERANSDLTLRLKTVGLDEGEQRFRMDGEGQYDGARFALTFRGDPLLDARKPERPYAMELDVDIVETRARASGSVLGPLALKGLDLELDLRGPNPQRLTRLLGVPLPELPPYSVSGKLTLQDQRWALANLNGVVGDSDLGGRLALDASAAPPRLTGKLHSESLDLDDLSGLVGDAPSTGKREAASARQAQKARADAGDRKVLPDDALVSDAWLAVSADVEYRGRSVRAADVPLSELVIDFRLEDGNMRFEPLRFGVGDGHVDLRFTLDSRTDPASGRLRAQVRRVDLRKALQEWELADDSVGIVAARGQFWVEGASLAELLASADGGLVFLMTAGKLDALLVELAGLDASQVFLSWLRGRDPVPINCAYADIRARSGVATLDTLVVDSDDTTFTAGGDVDLNTERLDITLLAHPKDVSVLVARTPLHLGGTFADIEPAIHGGSLGARAAASAALGAVGGPLAALLPLLDLGTGESSGYCQGLMRRTKKAMDGDGGSQ